MILTLVGYGEGDDFIQFFFESFPHTPTVILTDAELAAITTQAQLRAALAAKLRRKVLREGIASKLDPFIGQTITI